MMYWGNGMGGWGYLMMALNLVLFWGLIITAVVLLVRFMGGDRRVLVPTNVGTDPHRLLAERYARGEIDEVEYRQRLKVLGGSTRSPTP
jgi:putative membrane protein